MPRGTGKEPSGSTCTCDSCAAMDKYPVAALHEVFTAVMQSVWGPVEVEALVTTETFRVTGGKSDQDDNAT
jgi:hypothetical protein